LRPCDNYSPSYLISSKYNNTTISSSSHEHKAEEQGIQKSPTSEESQESSSCLENCSVLPQIKKLFSVSEGFLENRKLSEKIGNFLQPSRKVSHFSETRKKMRKFLKSQKIVFIQSD
jgi:hypothetical protein